MSNNLFFTLKTGMFVTCSGEWDEKTQQYKSADSTQIAKCCLDQCKAPVKFCRKYCYDNNKPGEEFNSPILMQRCLETCQDERNLCIDTCRLISPYAGGNNDYVQCATNFGCRGLNDLPDPECVKKNKNAIFQCCRQTCIPTKNVDCQQHCEFLQKEIINPDDVGIPSLNNKTLRELNSKFKTYPDNTPTWILGAVILSIIVVVLWIFFSTRK